MIQFRLRRKRAKGGAILSLVSPAVKKEITARELRPALSEKGLAVRFRGAGKRFGKHGKA